MVPPNVKSMACVLLRQLFDRKFTGAVNVATMDAALLADGQSDSRVNNWN